MNVCSAVRSAVRAALAGALVAACESPPQSPAPIQQEELSSTAAQALAEAQQLLIANPSAAAVCQAEHDALHAAIEALQEAALGGDPQGAISALQGAISKLSACLDSQLTLPPDAGTPGTPGVVCTSHPLAGGAQAEVCPTGDARCSAAAANGTLKVTCTSPSNSKVCVKVIHDGSSSESCFNGSSCTADVSASGSQVTCQ